MTTGLLRVRHSRHPVDRRPAGVCAYLALEALGLPPEPASLIGIGKSR